jgi:putative addiction module CopG family antidote
MRDTRSLSIKLPVDMARMVKDKVASGAYADESEVIQDGLRALQAHDAVVESWLREAVVPVFDRVVRGDEKLLEASEVFPDLAARYRARKTTGVPLVWHGSSFRKRHGPILIQSSPGLRIVQAKP